MPVIKYNDLITYASLDNAEYYIIPASNVSITTQNSLAASRILAANQNNNFRIGGELNCKINITFWACNSITDDFYSLNFANLLFFSLTGQSGLANMGIGSSVFNNCYLDNASINISPFAPVSVNAQFTCLNPPIGDPLFINETQWNDDFNTGIAYGFNTPISGGSILSDGNIENLTYSVTCNRTYSTTIGANSPNLVFLNEVEKELSIKARNIGEFINYSGYGDSINIDPKNNLGQSIISGGIGMSANSRIVSQNLSITEGEILAGDISLREVIL